MKGLLIKDFKLLKGQASLGIFLVLAMGGIGFFTNNPSVIMGYMSIFGPLCALGSVSYDEYDNGFPFLFTLPITRKEYVTEKYGFGLILGGSLWILALLITSAMELAKSSFSMGDTALAAFVLLAISLIMMAVVLPVRLKFGNEKGSLAIICVAALIFLFGFLIMTISKMFNIDIISILDQLSLAGAGILAVASMVIAFLLLLLSYLVSLAIMNKKEF